MSAPATPSAPPSAGGAGISSSSSSGGGMPAALAPAVLTPGSRGLRNSASSPDFTSIGAGGFAGALSEEQLSVYSLREARKRTDLDAQTLANRIALLRQEGEKACRKLNETRWKTRELEQRPFKAEEMQAHLRKRLEDLQMQQMKNQYNREQGRATRKDVHAMLLEQRRAAARELRENSKKMQESKKRTDEAMHAMLTERVTALKDRVAGQEKQQMLEERRIAQFQKNREERMARSAVEVLLRSNTEQRISEMEREEEELMEWLKAKQLEQRAAYEELAVVAENRRAGNGSKGTSMVMRSTAS
mmetsp:Transcript_140502/g.356574  ORF Transcript_140502/g.356574 Transcript_140502/m.356574 type:complete len:303 (+) Transcript_140502:125-1033(+)